VIGGAVPSAISGWHIHAGHSCATDAAVGGHYYTDMDSDPWTAVTYLGDGAGSSVISLTISNFTLQPGAAHNVAGRVIVVHVDGLKAACGVIEPYGIGHAEVITIGKYPDAPTSETTGYTVPDRTRRPRRPQATRCRRARLG